MKLKERAERLKTDIPAVFLALKDKETPVTAKIIAAVTVCYALSPIDLIPDFIPILGYLDDLIILPALVALVIKLIPKDVWERCRSDAENLWENGRPKKWYYAIPIVLIWLLIIVLACIIFSVFASSPPVINSSAAAVTQVWSYVGELIFNMLVLTGSVKMADRIVKEMMGM